MRETQQISFFTSQTTTKVSEIKMLSRVPLPTAVTREHEEVNNNLDVYKSPQVQQVKSTEGPQVKGHQEEESQETVAIYELHSSYRIEVKEQDEWLCIARLPLEMSQEEFLELIQEFGVVKQYFLVFSEYTGKSKGYGLVKYLNKCSSIEARHVLDRQEIQGHVLDCDWLKPGLSLPKPTGRTAISLHSKCLFVDRLPEDYRDLGEFRRLFSKVVNPPYCQIAMKNGVIQKWGLVEFQSSQEAEATLDLLNGQLVNGEAIRVQFCIPGTHAIHIYMNFINNPMDAHTEKKALLEEAPSPKVYDQLNSLAQKNPWFVQSLQKIMSSASVQDQSLLNQLPPNLRESAAAPLPPPPPGGDPAQAALILLLAGRVSSSTSDQSVTSLLQGILKKLELGENAADILRSLLPNYHNPGASTAELIQTALNFTNDEQTQKKQPLREKDPQLMDLLYRSFQAKLARGDFNPKKSPSAKTATMTSPPPKANKIDQPKMAEICHQPPPAIQYNDPQFNAAMATAPPPMVNTPMTPMTDLVVKDSYPSITQNPHQAFLGHPGVLSMGQHHFYSPMFTTANPAAGLIPLQTQFMWPTQMGLYPTTPGSPFGAAAYTPTQQVLSNSGAFLQTDPLAAYQQYQSNHYLAQMSLKRACVSDYEVESKRLRLTTMPF